MGVEDIKRLIEAGLPGAEIDVQGDDGTHFSAIIISGQFAGKSTVQQHQLVYNCLGERMGREIHALSMRTFTPEQWQKEKELRVI